MVQDDGDSDGDGDTATDIDLDESEDAAEAAAAGKVFKGRLRTWKLVCRNGKWDGN